MKSQLHQDVVKSRVSRKKERDFMFQHCVRFCTLDCPMRYFSIGNAPISLRLRAYCSLRRVKLRAHLDCIVRMVHEYNTIVQSLHAKRLFTLQYLTRTAGVYPRLTLPASLRLGSIAPAAGNRLLPERASIALG